MTEDLKVEALHDKIVIKRIELERVTASGIVLGNSLEKDRDTGFGRVLAVGPGKQIDTTGVIPTKVQIGDIISFMERIPRKVTLKGEDFYILRESDVDFINRDEELQEVRYETTTGDYENIAAPLEHRFG